MHFATSRPAGLQASAGHGSCAPGGAKPSSGCPKLPGCCRFRHSQTWRGRSTLSFRDKPMEAFLDEAAGFRAWSAASQLKPRDQRRRALQRRGDNGQRPVPLIRLFSSTSNVRTPTHRTVRRLVTALGVLAPSAPSHPACIRRRPRASKVKIVVLASQARWTSRRETTAYRTRLAARGQCFHPEIRAVHDPTGRT